MRRIFSTLGVMVAYAAFSSISSAAPNEIRAGSTTSFAPGSNQPCFVGIAERDTRALTRVAGDCIFENQALRARVFATSGPGIARVDVLSEVKVIVSQFEVPTAPDAPTTSYLPIHIAVPVSWAGQFFNMTVLPAATANVNMSLRLRESDASDPNIAGTLISQNRFHGASHGGIFNCMSVPTDLVSAATMMVGCADALTESEGGQAFAELSGVIRTNQVYNVELVIRAELFAPVVIDPINGYVPERINFADDFGLTWRNSATIHVGTDAERTVGQLREDIAELQADLAKLRSDFDGHYHTYLTGKGAGHNSEEAQTPPPELSSEEQENGGGGEQAPQNPATGSATGDTGSSAPDGPVSGSATIAAATGSSGGGTFGFISSGLLLSSLLARSIAARRG